MLDLAALLERARLTADDEAAVVKRLEWSGSAIEHVSLAHRAIVDTATVKAIRVILEAVEDELETEYGSHFPMVVRIRALLAVAQSTDAKKEDA